MGRGQRIIDNKAEVDAVKKFKKRSPAPLGRVALLLPGVLGSRNAVFRRALESGPIPQERFRYCLGVAEREADAGGHQQGNILEAAGPTARVELALRDHIERGHRTRRRQEERDVDE